LYFCDCQNAESTEFLQDGADSLPVTIGLAAATGLGVLAYTEVTMLIFFSVLILLLTHLVQSTLQVETLLQFVGSAAIVQLVISRLLYAEVHISFQNSFNCFIAVNHNFIPFNRGQLFPVLQNLMPCLCCLQDRKKTVKQIEEFFNNKVAPLELVDEIKVPSHVLKC
jgi:chitinase domain-containing protein 1